MSAYLLDTNHASPVVTLSHPLRKEVLARLEAGDTFSVCVPVVTELMHGIATLPRAKATIAEWRRLRPRLDCHIPDEVDAELAAELQVSLRLRGKQLETVDALIAAVALRYELILLTTDKDFSAIPTLRRDNWLVK